jgi:hypothetical protein
MTAAPWSCPARVVGVFYMALKIAVNESVKKVVFFLCLLLAVFGAAYYRSAKRDLKITVKEKRVQGLNEQGLTLSFILQIANSSPEPWFMASYDYRVLVMDFEYFRLQRALDPPLVVGPSGTTLISLPVKITYDYLFQSHQSAGDRDKLECTLVGGIFFAEHAGERGDRINVAMTGDFPVYKGLQTIVRPIEVRALSVGGADLTFRAEIRNLSPIKIQAQSISYKLEIGGKQVAQGKAPSEIGLDPLAAMPFELPLLLEFFEIGPELYPLLQKPELGCRFWGEILISIPWGDFLMPFDLSQKVPVKRTG